MAIIHPTAQQPSPERLTACTLLRDIKTAGICNHCGLVDLRLVAVSIGQMVALRHDCWLQGPSGFHHGLVGVKGIGAETDEVSEPLVEAPDFSTRRMDAPQGHTPSGELSFNRVELLGHFVRRAEEQEPQLETRVRS